MKVYSEIFFLLSWMSFKYIEHKQVILTYQRAQATQALISFGEGEKKSIWLGCPANQDKS